MTLWFAVGYVTGIVSTLAALAACAWHLERMADDLPDDWHWPPGGP